VSRITLLGAAAALFAAASLLPEGRLLASDVGAASRDAEGRFENRAGPIERAGASVTLPFFVRRLGTTISGRDGAPPSVANDGAFLRENARHSVPTVTWIGHATLLVQMDHATFLTDPIWSDRASPLSWLGPKRSVAPGLALDALPPIDFVIVSHDHYDHLDIPTLRALARRSPGTVFVTPLGNGALLREEGIANVRELDWGGRTEVRGLDVFCVPVQHWSSRSPGDERRRLWAGFAVIGPERRFYFSGDAGYSPDFAYAGAAFGPFDLAALSIGAYEPAAMMRPFHLNPEEAVQAGRELRAKRLVPVHYGTFDLSDEPYDEPPRRFRAAAAAAGYAADDAPVLEIGETRRF
jgi:N-acyl-phosphatidylethanolamine-hydrolysing phospholipase D